jgi:hypothetical protein
MPEANINDRSSVERLYPREAFARDAAENADAKAAVYRGLRIVSPIDREGRFSAERGSRHVGERDPEGDTIFLAPFLAQADAPLGESDAYGGLALAGDVLALTVRKAQDYRSFIDRIIEAARAAEFKSAVGLHDDRLHGFHGG